MSGASWRDRLVIRQGRPGDIGTLFDPDYPGDWYAFHCGSPGRAFLGPYNTYNDALDALDDLSDRTALQYFADDCVPFDNGLH